MFDNLTAEQREAFKRRTHAIDAALKSAIAEPQPEVEKKPVRHLQFGPKLHIAHAPQPGQTPHGHAQVA